MAPTPYAPSRVLPTLLGALAARDGGRLHGDREVVERRARTRPHCADVKKRTRRRMARNSRRLNR